MDAPALDAGHSTFDVSQPNGLLVPPRDIPAADRALEFLILNPEVRKQIGEAARKKIEADLSWDAVAKKYLEMFEEARRSSEYRVTGAGAKDESRGE